MRWLIAALAWSSLVLGACSSDPAPSDEFVALEQELAEAKQDLVRAEVLLTEVTAERDALVANAGRIAIVKANEAAHFQAFLNKDLDATMDTYADDAVWVDETYGDYIVGKAAVRSMMSRVVQFTDPDASAVLDSFVSEDGTRAVSTWEWKGTDFFGNPFDLPFALIDEYENGKIVKQTIYYASPNSRQLLGG